MSENNFSLSKLTVSVLRAVAADSLFPEHFAHFFNDFIL